MKNYHSDWNLDFSWMSIGLVVFTVETLALNANSMLDIFISSIMPWYNYANIF